MCVCVWWGNVGKTKDVLTEDTEEAFEDELTANVVKTEN